MTYLQKGELANDNFFKLRVRIAMIMTAKNILDDEDTARVSYDILHNFASQVVRNQETNLTNFAFFIASEPDVTKDSTYEVIQTKSNNLFKFFAGVKPSQETEVKPTFLEVKANLTRTTIEVLANKGIQPYEYFLDNVSRGTTNIFTNLTAGATYLVGVKDKTNSRVDASFTLPTK